MNKIDCLAFGAHPDDVELFCSGLLIKLQKKGFTTAVIDLTKGELSTNGTEEIRAVETINASEIMNLSFRENLNFEDGNIKNTKQNRLEIIKILRNYRPQVVLQPYWEDRHPDHVAASKIVTDACFYSGLKKIETKKKPYRPETVLYYMMHTLFTPSFIVDISDEMETKIKTIKCYQSQFNQSGDKTDKTIINQPEFFDSIVNRAKFYGYEIKKKFGEPYYYKGFLRIDNVVDFFS